MASTFESTRPSNADGLPCNNIYLACFASLFRSFSFSPARWGATCWRRIPPSGGASLRKFMTDYVKTNKALPTGKVSVPYAQGESSSSPQGSFLVDFDELIKG